MGQLFQMTPQPVLGFQSFWVRWPRKVGRMEAEQAWKKNVRPEDEALIQAALDWQVPMFEQRETEYIPHAKTWLRNRRWEDEQPKPKSPTASRPIEIPEWQRRFLPQERKL